jgi:hypothetical protein
MPLLGAAALLLSFDVAKEAIREHDHWHTHEHLPERLSIPGFLRGTRWAAVRGEPRYMVLYEVESLDTLSSAAYLERLNSPTPWTSKMMSHYRGMVRGLCSVVASEGLGGGRLCLLVRFQRAAGAEAAIDAWLREDVLRRLPSQPGLGGAHLLRGAAQARMTNEQRIRGADAAVDSALIVTGYDEPALERAEQEILGDSGLGSRGATGLGTGLYEMHYTLSQNEVSRASA